MSLPLAMAAVDAAAAVYLVGWALRRQRRDKPLVAIVGVVLALCAIFLAVVGWPREAGPTAPSLPPARTSTAV